MAFVIGGKEYELTNDEWMFPAKTLSSASLAQGGLQKLNFMSPGPLGPQIMAQLDTDTWDAPPLEDDFDYVQAEADIRSSNGSKSIKACSSTIMTMDISHKMFLVGDVFMRKFYTIFDRDENKVGLAKAKGYSGHTNTTDE